MEIIKNIDKKKFTIMCFSDIHGNLEALKAIMGEMDKISPDLVVFLGDAIGVGPDSDECVSLLRSKELIYLKGNHEYFQTDGYKDMHKTKTEIEHIKWIGSKLSKENIEYLKTLPTKCVLNFKDCNMQFSHFLFKGRDEFANLAYLIERGFSPTIIENNNCNYVFYGHDHLPNQRSVKNINFICTGSSGCTINSKTFYNLITYDKYYVKVERKNIEYDRETFVQKIKSSDYPNREHYMHSIFNIS